MLINFVDATNDANHYTKLPPMLTRMEVTVGRRDLIPSRPLISTLSLLLSGCVSCYYYLEMCFMNCTCLQQLVMLWLWMCAQSWHIQHRVTGWWSSDSIVSWTWQQWQHLSVS